MALWRPGQDQSDHADRRRDLVAQRFQVGLQQRAQGLVALGFCHIQFALGEFHDGTGHFANVYPALIDGQQRCGFWAGLAYIAPLRGAGHDNPGSG